MIPNLLNSDIDRLIYREFQECKFEEVKQILEDYRCDLNSEADKNRVYAAIIKLSCGDILSLKSYVDQANVNKDEVIHLAEKPYFITTDGLDGTKVEGPFEQYTDWLNSKKGSRFSVVFGKDVYADPYPYVHVKFDGSYEELTPEDRSYLETEFFPGDGGRPYVKSTYWSLRTDCSIDGYCPRATLPQGLKVNQIPVKKKSWKEKIDDYLDYAPVNFLMSLFAPYEYKMKTVYRFDHNKTDIQNIQKQMMSKDKRRYKNTHGLIGSQEWWDNIHSGNLEVAAKIGKITRVYVAGHNDFAMFDLELIGGYGTLSMPRKLSKESYDKYYKVGKKIVIKYALQKPIVLSDGDDMDNGLILDITIEK